MAGLGVPQRWHLQPLWGSRKASSCTASIPLPHSWCSTGAERADTTVALVGLSSPELFPSLGQKGLSNPASHSA